MNITHLQSRRQAVVRGSPLGKMAPCSRPGAVNAPPVWPSILVRLTVKIVAGKQPAVCRNPHSSLSFRLPRARLPDGHLRQKPIPSKCMRSLTYALILSLAASCSLFADDASKDAKIVQLLAVLHAEIIQDQIYAQLGQQIERATMGLAQKAGIAATEQRSATAELATKMTDMVKENMNWEKLRPAIVQAYHESFSEEEMDAILAFYKSPIGLGYLTKAPQLAQRSRTIAEGKLRELGVTFDAMAKEWTDKHPKAEPAKQQ